MKVDDDDDDNNNNNNINNNLSFTQHIYVVHGSILFQLVFANFSDSLKSRHPLCDRYNKMVQDSTVTTQLIM